MSELSGQWLDMLLYSVSQRRLLIRSCEKVISLQSYRKILHEGATMNTLLISLLEKTSTGCTGY